MQFMGDRIKKRIQDRNYMWMSWDCSERLTINRLLKWGKVPVLLVTADIPRMNRMTFSLI